MSSVHRAFTQKLSKQNAADVRRQVCNPSPFQKSIPKSNSSVSGLSTISIASSEIVEPVDYEDFMQQNHVMVSRDPLRDVLEFPEGDVEVGVVPRKIRTEMLIVPEEPPDQWNIGVRDVVRCHTANWVVVSHRYRHHSSSCWVRDRAGERHELVKSLPKQQFEVDQDGIKEEDRIQEEERDARSSAETPRGSWASFDLRNSVSDALLSELLQKNPPETIDSLNEIRRLEDRQSALFLLYPSQDEEEIVERRIPAEMPSDHLGHRILVKCLQLKLELEVEPIFASMALYDAKEKKKVSENFYFDLNSESIKRMLSSHVPFSDISTQSRSCIFNITYPSADLFLVIKLEKVLQGDITECAEPYMKEDKNREKVKVNAVTSCDRLGKYRMPFAWTAVYMMNVFNGSNSLERDSGSDKESVGSNSLDLFTGERKSNSSFEQFKRKASDMSNLTRRGSLERRCGEKRRSWSPEDLGASVDTFRPITLTVSNFFKQEGDKLRDEDLFKFLQDLKRPAVLMKKLKCIPATLKLDISPCPEEFKYCLTPELAQLRPYPDDKGRPTKEILEIIPREIFAPNYVYRDLMYVYPKDVNFASRTVMAGSARNIAVKIQLMSGEDESNAMPCLFGRSSCPEFSSEQYTAVTYHNKNPDFYDEFKLKIPCNLSSNHHLLFTFYHISCQKKSEQPTVETPIGYTWLPLLRDYRLQTGEFSLPITTEKPPSNYSYIPPDVNLPNMKWLDNHKGIFSVFLEAESTVHTKDRYLDRFLYLSELAETGHVPRGIGEANLETELKMCLADLTHANTEPLVRFLPLILDKLVNLVVRSPAVGSVKMNLSREAFEALTCVVKNITNLQEGHKDQHGRHSLLTSYINYQTSAAFGASGVSLSGFSPPQSPGYMPRPTPISPTRHSRSTSHPDLHEADEEIAMITKGIDRTASMRSPVVDTTMVASKSRKLLHEEIVLQWVVSSGTAKELALTNSWFFFELMVKSMVTHLASLDMLEAPRRVRFTDQFLDDITSLVTMVTSEIVARVSKDLKTTTNLNASLAFFLFDCLSIADRGFVFGLVKLYCKHITAKMMNLPDATGLIHLKSDLLRIVCSHEHFVALNLPFGTPFAPNSGPASPSPSVSSSNSQSSFLSTLVGGDKSAYADLSPEFRQQHFLVGLILGELPVVFDTSNPHLHAKCVNMIRNLMTCHDCDPRYADPECKSRVAALYLPLLGIVMDCLGQLHTGPHDNAKDPKGPFNEEAENQPDMSQNIAMVIAGSLSSFQQPSRKTILTHETTRNLLTCFLWVIKNVNTSCLKQWWAELPNARLRQLLEVLYISISCFEYKGKKVTKKRSQPSFRKTSEMKSKLEDVILGKESARNEMMMRRKEKNPQPGGTGERLRWRKEVLTWKSSNSETSDRPKAELEMDAHIEGNFCTEIGLVILDTLENIVQVASHSDNLQSLLGSVLKVILHFMSKSQSTTLLKNIFASQRSLIFKFPNLLFDEETEQCSDLCSHLLKHCSSSISTVRSQAAASLYLLMRQNFEIGNNLARVKMQVTMSLSSLVGTDSSFNEESLRRSLKTVLVYAEEDNEMQDTSFPEQVKDLIFNLHMILSDTVKMKEFQEDPEMLIDLMYRIARGYRNSPDLRLTWLSNMAKKHLERGNHTEAAMCLVSSSALVAEYLHMLEDQPHMPIGAVAFRKVTPNALLESAVSDDVVSPDEEGVCLGKDFTEQGLIFLLEHAASYLNSAGMFEAVDEVYQILLPIVKSNRDYKRLSAVHRKLYEAYERIDQMQGKRIFGTYFRVGFYGSKFGDLNGVEYIYKEPSLTKLHEIFSRLENFYSERFGPENVVTIKDSNTVDVSTLDPEKAYIQITYVEPYFEPFEMKYRPNQFDKNYNIKRFIYATPFTPDGRAHGELHEQYKRKTILTTSTHFPYVKTRIQVVDRRQVVLSPIEVAIEDMQKKTQELAQATNQEPPDPKMLQMVLQGCIGTTVNQGPLEVAVVFLSNLTDGQTKPTRLQNKLRLCFKDFSKKCGDALRKNKNLIGPDQREYQRELERNHNRFCERLIPLVNTLPADSYVHCAKK
ncbi:dedicator of cytokinesis protein 7 isoform X2 [Neocloeon triangulifer]|uniref:dedicator of cytokinesis protein 7 isoform X2 n=1 Tax=Neocloeon triangulifer TaxID=2078957 RepID=UPI00286F3E87|nr:dedicator of cytokinesis protein 7 isoform X2 [Neocloeon triangulifer]